MAYVAVAIFLLLIVGVIAYYRRRMRDAGEMEAGGSLGHQFFGGDRDDDWGPKS